MLIRYEEISSWRAFSCVDTSTLVMCMFSNQGFKNRFLNVEAQSTVTKRSQKVSSNMLHVQGWPMSQTSAQYVFLAHNPPI